MSWERAIERESRQVIRLLGFCEKDQKPSRRCSHWPKIGHFSNKDKQNDLIVQIKYAYNPELKENLLVSVEEC